MDRYGYTVDLALGIGAAVLVLVLWRTGRWPAWTGPAYVVGCLLGAVWETTFTALGPHFRPDDPMWREMQIWPLWWWTQPLVHSLWDGALFLAAAGLVVLVRRPAAAFDRWRPADLAVLLGGGVGTSFLVESYANGRLWEYVARPYNPRLFELAGQEYTLWPLLTWLLAVPLFHLAVLALRRRPADVPTAG